MPHHPIHIEQPNGAGPRKKAWDAMREKAKKGKDFALLDLVRGAASTATVRDYVIGLTNAGYLETTTPNPLPRGQIKRWKLIKDVGAEAPRVRRDGSIVTAGRAREQMWRALRMIKTDTNAIELASFSSTAAELVTELMADDYLRVLTQAGYMRITKEGTTVDRRGGSRKAPLARYLLISNTGPRPPMVCRADTVFDPNLNAIVWVRPVTEEDAIYAK